MKTLTLTDEEALVVVQQLICGPAAAADYQTPLSDADQAIVERVLAALGYKEE